MKSLFPLFLLSIFAVSPAAPQSPVWNQDWKQFRLIAVQETEGLARTGEPVDTELLILQPVRKGNPATLAEDMKRELRIVHYSPGDRTYREIPSQVYDIRPVIPAGKTPERVTVRFRVAFFVDAAPYSSETYYLFFDNPNAPAPRYPSPLAVTGKGVKYTVDNMHYRILTEEKCGQIDQIDLKFSSQASFRFKYGTLHWNPDFIVLPEEFPKKSYVWWYAHHFIDPPCAVESGPVFFSMERKQLIPGQDTAYMEVYYRFYAGLPYFLMTSRIEAKKDCRTFAIRNDELAFGQRDFTHAAWRDKTPDLLEHHMGEIGTSKIWGDDTVRDGGHPLGSSLPANMAWVSLFNTKNGDGVASLRLEHENRNVLTGEPSPIYNSHTVISEHDEGFYWFRSLVYSPRGFAAMTQEEIDHFLISIPRGSSYFEKNAYLLYEFTAEQRFAAVDSLWMRLKYPLEAHEVK
jgi:hypothetical protein